MSHGVYQTQAECKCYERPTLRHIQVGQDRGVFVHVLPTCDELERSFNHAHSTSLPYANE